MSITIYILHCADGTYYTGLTRKMAQRLDEHSRGRARYTQSRLPVRLVHEEKFADEATALARERQIKNWSHDKKMNLIERRYHEITILAKKKFG